MQVNCRVHRLAYQNLWVPIFFTLKNISTSSLFELFVTYVIDNLWAIYFDVWTVQILIFEL